MPKRFEADSAAVKAFAGLLILVACAPTPKPAPSYIPEIPAPPKTDPIANMRDQLRLLEASSGADRLVHAEKLFNLVRAHRGDFGSNPPEDLPAFGPEVWSVYSKLGADKTSRLWLIRTAALCRHSDTLSAIMEIADKESDVDTLCVVADALGSSRDPRAVSTLSRLCSSENEHIRRFAIFNVGVFKEESVPPLLRTKLRDESEEVRWYAAYGLGFHHKDPSGFDVLVRMMNRDHVATVIDPKKPQAEVLTQRIILLAVAALRNLRDSRAIDPLRHVIRTDPSTIVKDACRETIRLLEGAQ
jgi:hypothetical protein